MGDAIFDFEVVKVAGAPAQDFWSGNFFEKPADSEKLEYRGQLFLVIGLGNSKNPVDLAHQFWTELASTFYNNLQGSVLSALQEAVKGSVNAVLPQVSFTESGLVAASLWGKILYLVCVGQASAALVRSDKFSKILEGGNSLEQIASASGFLQNGDLIILATAPIFEKFEDLTGLSGKLVQELEEELAARIEGRKEPQKIAASVLKIKEALQSAQAEVVTFTVPPQGEKTFSSRVFRLLEQIFSNFWVKSVFLPRTFFKLTGRLLPERNIYLKFSPSTFARKNLLLVIFAVLVLVLIVSLSVGIWQRQRKQDYQKFAELFARAQNLYSESVEIASVNRLRSRELLSEAQKNLDQAKKIKFDKGRVTELADKIQQANLQSLKLIKVDNPTLIFDLGTVKSGAVISEIEKPENILAFDKSGQTLFFVDTKAKTGQILSGGEKFSEFVNFTASGNAAYFFKPGDGIYQLDLGTKELKKVVQATNFGEILDLTGFSANLYLLDGKLGQIWKATRGDAGFSEFRQFITKTVQVDWGNSTFTIDGFIWVLALEGKIYQVTPTDVKLIEISGLDRGMSAKTILRTAADAENLYIADVGNSRILVLSKAGLYLAQYSSGFFSNLSDFTVDEPGGKLYFVQGSKIFAFDLVK